MKLWIKILIGIVASIAIAAIVILVVANSMFGFLWSSSHYSWNQKYTIEIQTPSGMKSGSSVTKLSYKYNGNMSKAAFANAHYFKMTGEATVVNLDNERYLFALVVREGSQFAPFHTFGPILGIQKNNYQKLAPKISGYHKKVEVPKSIWPLLVTFTNINDPKTVKRVDPNDLTSSFGAGYKLKSITLEITDEPVTKGLVEEVLGWLGDGHTLKQIWSNLSPQQHDLLSSINWRKGS